MAIKKDTLDDLLANRDPKAVFSKDGLFDELKKALAERVLNAELDDHLDTEAAEGSRNRRNGFSKKTVLTETSKIDVRIPRDREGTFDPKLIQRYQRRFPGFDDKIVSMYARGMTVREIQGHRNAQKAGYEPATRVRPLVDGLSAVGWMMGAG
jgi:putative transposase